MNFAGKKVLMFAPSFFGYEKEIKAELEKQGAKVVFEDDKPSNSTFHKVIIRLNPKLDSKIIHSYFNRVIEKYKTDSFDYVFFIKCEAALKQDLENLKKTFSNAKFIYYLYDSIENIKFYDMKREHFDKIFTFDQQDAKQHNEMILRPLFYLDCYKKEITETNYKYDLCFIGTAHSDRAKIINTIRKQLINENRKGYFRIFSRSKLLHKITCLIDKDYRELDSLGLVTFDKIPALEVSHIIEQSNAVLDIQHPKQTGLTMRTIELLGMNKKMVTTNAYIKEYDFYNRLNIEVIDRCNIQITDNIFKNLYRKIDSKIYDYYSISEWVREVFEEE